MQVYLLNSTVNIRLAVDETEQVHGTHPQQLPGLAGRLGHSVELLREEGEQGELSARPSSERSAQHHFVAWQPPGTPVSANDLLPKQRPHAVPTQNQMDTLEAYRKGDKTADDVVASFGGAIRVAADYINAYGERSSRSPLSQDQHGSLMKALKDVMATGAPASKEQLSVLDAYRQGRKTEEAVVIAFGGKHRVGDYLKHKSLSAEHHEALIRSAYTVVAKEHEAGRKAARIDFDNWTNKVGRSLEGKDHQTAIRTLNGYHEALQASGAGGPMIEHLQYRRRQHVELLNDSLTEDSVRQSPSEVASRNLKLAEELEYSPAEKASLFGKLVRRASVDESKAVELQTQWLTEDASRQLDCAARTGRLTGPIARAARTIDLTAEILKQGNGAAAAGLLEREALKADQAAQQAAPSSPERRLLDSFAEIARTRADLYRASHPGSYSVFKQRAALGMNPPHDSNSTFDSAWKLGEIAGRAEQTAHGLYKVGRAAEARLLRDIAVYSRFQAETAMHGVRASWTLIGQGVSQTYQKIVERSFEKEINATSETFRPTKHKKLVDEKEKMKAVFAELDRTMRQSGVPLSQAFDEMNGDAKVLPAGHPLTHVGIFSRKDAALLLINHEITKGLIDPFMKLSEAAVAGDSKAIDAANSALIKALQKGDQWTLAGQLLKDYQRSARSSEGRVDAEQLAGRETGDWLKAKSEQFVREELPVLVLSALFSGGVGAGVKGLTTAAQWGPRAVKGTRAAAEIGSLVPTEKLLNGAINGKAMNWSPGTLATDYAFAIGGYGLFHTFGKGWQYVRGRSSFPAHEPADIAHKLGTPPENQAAHWQAWVANRADDYAASLRSGNESVEELLQRARREYQTFQAEIARARAPDGRLTALVQEAEIKPIGQMRYSASRPDVTHSVNVKEGMHPIEADIARQSRARWQASGADQVQIGLASEAHAGLGKPGYKNQYQPRNGKQPIEGTVVEVTQSNGAPALRIHYPTSKADIQGILDDVVARADELLHAARAGRLDHARALDEFADIAYGYHQAMPFTRGSDGISQQYLRAIYTAVTGQKLPSNIPMMDIHAMTMGQAEFRKWLVAQLPKPHAGPIRWDLGQTTFGAIPSVGAGAGLGTGRAADK